MARETAAPAACTDWLMTASSITGLNQKTGDHVSTLSMRSRQSDLGLMLLFCMAVLVLAASNTSTPRLVSHQQSYASATTELPDFDEGAYGRIGPIADHVVVTASLDLGEGSLLQLSLHRADQHRIPVRHLKLGSPPDDPFSVI